MKTIANCTTGEFIKQIYTLSEKIKKYADNIKKLKADNIGDTTQAFSLIKAICNDNIEDTFEICGAMCFMSGEEFANLDPAQGDDGVVAISQILGSERCINFFMSALKMKNIYSML